MLLSLFLLLNISSALVFTVYNPVYAAFWLIVTFCSSAILIWFFNSSFFALIYIIIYVGAIAVLFLFVIMMLDIKNTNPNTNLSYQINKFLILIIPSFGLSYFITSKIYIENFVDFEENFLTNFDLTSNIHAFGQILYNYYIICILIAGLILLVAILGAIVLTLNINHSEKIKISSRQLARSENFLTFFK